MFKNEAIVPSCPNCNQELQAVSNDEKVSSIENLQFDCVGCGYRYGCVSVDSLEESKYAKPLYCEFCEKHFNQLNALKRHMNVHSLIRPFVCDVCEKCFKTKAALKRHTIIHTGECPFECSTCKRKFNQISNLRKHLVIHSNNCPFYCSVCGKGFNQLSNMKKHSVVHRNYEDISDSEGKKPKRSVVPKGKEKEKAVTTRPVLTFIKPAES